MLEVLIFQDDSVLCCHCVNNGLFSFFCLQHPFSYYLMARQVIQKCRSLGPEKVLEKVLSYTRNARWSP